MALDLLKNLLIFLYSFVIIYRKINICYFDSVYCERYGRKMRIFKQTKRRRKGYLSLWCCIAHQEDMGGCTIDCNKWRGNGDIVKEYFLKSGELRYVKGYDIFREWCTEEDKLKYLQSLDCFVEYKWVLGRS